MSLLIAFLLTLLLGHFSQYLTAKVIHPLPRPFALWLMEICCLSTLFIAFLLLHQRPILAGINTLSAVAVLLIVHHAKYKALREPLVFSDFYLYIQVVYHPRLFLPFLNIPVTIVAISGGLTLLYLALIWEPTITLNKPLLYSSGMIAIMICGCIIKTRANLTTLTLHPTEDIRNLGFFNSLLIYTLQAKQKNQREKLYSTIKKHSPFAKRYNDQTRAAAADTQKDIIVIQSESFFDPRRLFQGIDQQLLENYDRICAESITHGTLEVPSWGANTLRPEHSFLSGIDNIELEHYRFNPYQFLKNRPTPTIASYLKSKGYRCIAVHPHPASFFGRDKVFPLFGFDEFVDIADFDNNATSGPYISDQAVQEKIAEILDQHNIEQPLFIFAITMENHGPLHLESVTDKEVETFYQGKPPIDHRDFAVYLRHIANADLMLDTLTNKLSHRSKNAQLCFYGDHVPSMPGIYKELGFKNGRTDYLIWQNYPTTTHSKTEDLPISELSKKLL